MDPQATVLRALSSGCSAASVAVTEAGGKWKATTTTNSDVLVEARYPPAGGTVVSAVDLLVRAERGEIPDHVQAVSGPLITVLAAVAPVAAGKAHLSVAVHDERGLAALSLSAVPSLPNITDAAESGGVGRWLTGLVMEASPRSAPRMGPARRTLASEGGDEGSVVASSSAEMMADRVGWELVRWASDGERQHLAGRDLPLGIGLPRLATRVLREIERECGMERRQLDYRPVRDVLVDREVLTGMASGHTGEGHRHTGSARWCSVCAPMVDNTLDAEAMIRRAFDRAGLTAREEHALRLEAQGATPKQIGVELGVGDRQARNVVAAAQRKLADARGEI